MKKIKRYRIQIVFFFAMMVLLSLSLFSYIRIDNLIKTSSLVNHTGLVKLELEHFFSTLKDAESAQRGYLITKDPYHTAEYNKAVAQASRQLLALQQLTADNKAQRQNMQKLRELVQVRLKNLKWLGQRRTIVLEPNHIRMLRTNREALRSHINLMMHQEDLLLVSRTKSLTEESALTPMFTIFLVVGSLLVLLMAYLQIVFNEKLLAKRNASLKEKNESLAKINKELEAFTYISSHDLQEPLRKIQTFISRIIDKEFEVLSATGQNYLSRTQESANRMQNLIRDLLAYSRLKAEVFTLEKASLEDLVSEVKSDLFEEIEEKNVTVTTVPASEIRVIVPQFRQLLTNLISNAVKFSSPDRVPNISVSKTVVKGIEVPFADAHRELFYAKITLADNGIGFDNSYSERIFELFQRVHDQGLYIGTGIGLAIVKKIVENHNGFISAEGKVNQGATFTIYIPA